MKNRKYLLGGLLIVLVLIIAVAFVAKNAQPESSLYTLRTNVIEKTMLMFKSGSLAKANYQVNLIELRLKELENLKTEKKLGTQAGINARDSFNNLTVLLSANILELSKKDGTNSRDVLALSEMLDVQIESAKAIFNIDQLEVFDEGVPLPKATSTKVKK